MNPPPPRDGPPWPATPSLPAPPETSVWVPRRRRRLPRWAFLVAFAVTAYTVLTAGALPSLDASGRYVGIPGLFVLTADLSALADGLPYAAWLLAILGCHEMGHYLACRRYGIDATPPLFLPGPQLPFGTFGAFIRVRAPFPSRRALFDVGIAGPLAGFAVTLPALAVGFARSTVVADDGGGLVLGDSLLLVAMARWFGAPLPEGTTHLLHPAAYAGWVGTLATALNLLPAGQLDGGHIVYALLPRAHRLSTRLVGASLLALGVVAYPAWLFWGAIVLLFLRRPHPPTLHDLPPLPLGRRLLGAFALGMLAVCFIPAPFGRSLSE